MDERRRRQWAATEARELGWGGVSLVSRATGLSRPTITTGLRELDQPIPQRAAQAVSGASAGRRPPTADNDRPWIVVGAGVVVGTGDSWRSRVPTSLDMGGLLVSGVIGPGRPGGLLPQGSHRSGLARLRHPARRVVVPTLAWLRRPSIDSRVRFDALGEFSDDGPTTRHLLLSTGFRRACSPASAIVRDAPTPGRPSRRASLPSLGDTTPASGLCSLRPPTRGRGHRGFGVPGSRTGIVGGDGRVSQVPRDPSCALALFSDPGGTEHARPLRRVGVVPASDKDEDFREKLSGLNRTALALAVYASQ